MGLDFLDVTFRIEKNFNLRISNEDWTALATGRRPPDVTAGELFELIRRRRNCRSCEYDLRGHADAGVCPECGRGFNVEAVTDDTQWEILRRLLAEAMGVERDNIRRETLLVRDLGMT
jgi:acyl carrier protein